MTVPKSLAQMAADQTWQPWAEQGWTLQLTPGGRVLAINLARSMATNPAKHLITLVGRLEKGKFGYTQFLTFKLFNIP